MNRYLLTILLLLAAKLGYSQEPVFGLYWQNPFMYNVAYTGAEHDLVAVATYRQQWMGIEGAPQSINVGLHSPVKKVLGAGINIQQQQAGLLLYQSGRFSLAYELPLSSSTFLRTAVGGVYSTSRFDLTTATSEQLAYLQQYNFDAPITNYKWQAGVYLLHKDWLEIGAALLNLTGSPTASIEKARPHDQFFASLRVRRPLNQKLEISPGFIVQKLNALETRAEASTLFYWNKVAWAGGGYRLNSGPLFMMGFKAGKSITIGYAYELNVALNQALGSNTHELQLKYNYTLPQKVKTPVHRPRYEL